MPNGLLRLATVANQSDITSDVLLHSTNSRRTLRPTSARGFTLLEASLATMIVGVAFVAVLQLLAAGTVANLSSADLTTGINLAKNIRELTLQSKYVNLPTYNGTSYNPPHDSRGTSITDLDGWRQTIAVQSVDPNRLTTNIVDATPAAVRITATVSHNEQKVCDLSWYAFDATP